MTKTLLVACCVLSALLLLACNKTETPTNSSSAPANRPATAATTPATSTTTASTAVTGIAECDQYLTAYESCVKDKVPAAVRAQFNTSLEQQRKSWHDLAANPQTKASLAQACKTAIASANQSMKAYGCKF